MKFEATTELPVSQQAAFEYHARPGALNRLTPPWEPVNIVRSSDSIETGSEVLLRLKLLGIKLDWLARHERYEPPALFSDVQVYGPFASWLHSHSFSSVSDDRSLLSDLIDYELPLGTFGKYFGSEIARKKLESMFRFRHLQTLEDLRFGHAVSSVTGGETKTVAVSGGSGLIGQSVCSLITVLGHRLIRLVRPNSDASKNESSTSSVKTTAWDPEKGLLQPEDLEGVDAVIHLAGKGIGDGRWTESVRQELIASRVDATRVLSEQLAKLRTPPKAFVSASGVGIYGSIGNNVADENFPSADDFLGKLAVAWEAASECLESVGTRRCAGRLGIVLDPLHGALAKLLPVVRWGVGGPMGSGGQYWSWIAKEDAASAFIWLALNPECHGPFNLVAGSETNREFTKTLAKLLNRPSFLPVPAFALKLALGEMANSLLLASTNASNEKLVQTGFSFRSNTLEDAFRHILGLKNVDQLSSTDQRTG